MARKSKTRTDRSARTVEGAYVVVSPGCEVRPFPLSTTGESEAMAYARTVAYRGGVSVVTITTADDWRTVTRTVLALDAEGGER